MIYYLQQHIVEKLITDTVHNPKIIYLAFPSIFAILKTFQANVLFVNEIYIICHSVFPSLSRCEKIKFG